MAEMNLTFFFDRINFWQKFYPTNFFNRTSVKKMLIVYLTEFIFGRNSLETLFRKDFFEKFFQIFLFKIFETFLTHLKLKKDTFMTDISFCQEFSWKNSFDRIFSDKLFWQNFFNRFWTQCFLTDFFSAFFFILNIDRKYRGIVCTSKRNESTKKATERKERGVLETKGHYSRDTPEV